MNQDAVGIAAALLTFAILNSPRNEPGQQPPDNLEAISLWRGLYSEIEKEAGAKGRR